MYRLQQETSSSRDNGRYNRCNKKALDRIIQSSQALVIRYIDLHCLSKNTGATPTESKVSFPISFNCTFCVSAALTPCPRTPKTQHHIHLTLEGCPWLTPQNAPPSDNYILKRLEGEGDISSRNRKQLQGTRVTIPQPTPPG